MRSIDRERERCAWATGSRRKWLAIVGMVFALALVALVSLGLVADGGRVIDDHDGWFRGDQHDPSQHTRIHQRCPGRRRACEPGSSGHGDLGS